MRGSRSGNRKGRLGHSSAVRRQQQPDRSSVLTILRGKVDFRGPKRLLLIEDVEFFARLEANGFSRSDADLGSGARVASNAGFAGANIENAEAPQLDPLSLGQRPFEGLENGIDGSLGFVALEACALNHLVDDVLFYQAVPPSGGCRTQS